MSRCDLLTASVAGDLADNCALRAKLESVDCLLGYSSAHVAAYLLEQESQCRELEAQCLRGDA